MVQYLGAQASRLHADGTSALQAQAILDAGRTLWRALQMPAINPHAVESAQAFMMRVSKIDVMLCPCCKTGRLRVIEVLAGQARLSVPGSMVLQQSRGPP